MKSLLFVPFFATLVSAAVYTVGVGKDETTGKKGMGFDPSVINPAVGDTIVFEFRSGSHSVVQSSFENPCTPSGGFDTGVQTVDDSLSVDAPGLPTINLVVNDTKPMWLFDQAGGLCKQGAVLAVNPSSTEPAATFKENASKATTVASSLTSSAASTESGTETSTVSESAETSSSSSTPNSANVVNLSGLEVSTGLSVFIGLLAALL